MMSNQTIAIWTAVGIWLGAIATFCAVAVSLWLALRSEKVNLLTYAGLRAIAEEGVISPEHLFIGVTNRGARPVTINSIGWAVGKRRKRRYALQILGAHPLSANCPKTLGHGETATFIIPLEPPAKWLDEFVYEFMLEDRDIWLATLVAQVNTSVGQTVDVKPEAGLIERLYIAREKMEKSRQQENRQTTGNAV